MDLETYRKINELTYGELSEVLNLTKNKTYRICNTPPDDPPSIKLVDAIKITTKTAGYVRLEDLLPSDCFTLHGCPCPDLGGHSPEGII